MTEDQNEQAPDPAGSGSAPETAATPVPESSGQPIALPASTPETAAEAFAWPKQPDTPPMGVPQEAAPSVPQQGSYAMGALAGNPMLGDPTQTTGTYAGPPTDPNAPMWPAPRVAGDSGTTNHRTRNGLLAGAAALVVLAAGVGIGHAAWNNNPVSFSASPPSGSSHLPSGPSGNSFGNGNGNGNGFGNGSPFGGGSSNSGNTGANSGSSNASGPSDVNAIASKVDPGLVDVNTTLGYQSAQAAGTGIVLTSNGVILTNNHVIDGATSVSVTDVGNQKTYTASVVGYDRTKDIAVLQLHNASGLQTASLGDSSNASVGEQVVGVGNAGGTGGTPSAAGGTVTALNQSISASDEGDGTSEQLSGLIQSNADIQPGDSGGALVDTSGQVLGVDTAASAGFSFQTNGQSSGNQGFSIPINTAVSIARAIESGSASSTVHIGQTAFLGVEINPSGSGSSGSSGSSGNAGNSGNGGSGGGGFGGLFGGNSGNTGSSSASGAPGASVAGVVTNGPAQEAGLAQGDAITSIGGKTISSSNDLTNDMGIYHPGDKVTIGWTDGNGQAHTATVQLSSGPPQ